MQPKTLTALPVYNEVDHVAGAIAGALCYCHDVLVVDDGSTDGTGPLLAERDDILCITHPKNMGYGSALRSAFDFAIQGGYEVLVTIDCDGQHQPQLIPNFVERCWAGDADIVSGSRYLRSFAGDSDPPADRRRINETIIKELERRLGLRVTDAFCGFKAYRVSALRNIKLTETGYAMPLELWVQAVRLGLRIVELPVPRVYFNEKRSFGGALDDAETRLAVYRKVIHDALHRDSWQTPRGDRESLVEPPWEEAGDVLDGNLRRRDQLDYDLQGRALAEISQLARAELLALARRWTSAYRDVPTKANTSRAPIFLAGHQPQMFHPGVWFKSFALSELAAQHGATAVQLIVDSDLLGGTSLRVPAGTADAPRVEQMLFDQPEPTIAYEERRIEDPATFAEFGRAVAGQLGGLVKDPVMAAYWPLVCARAERGENLGACLAQARHQLEEDWGLETLEVPLSWICKSQAFQWFTAHLLARLPAFRTVYNEAIRDYRKMYRVRSDSHPAPELAEEGEWLESPFWVWTAERPERRRLFARAAGKETILSDRQSWEERLPLSAEGDGKQAAERLWELQQGRVRIRSRALVTTLWARMVLSDLFLHGIGGAKYDRVTDRLIARFFGLQPPGYMVLSATLQLPIARKPVSIAELRGVEQELRDMEFHPERFVGNADIETARRIAEKRQWIFTAPSVQNAKQRCQAIHEINRQMQPELEGRRQELLERRAEMVERLQAEKALGSREYAFCLYPESYLREFFAGLLHKTI